MEAYYDALKENEERIKQQEREKFTEYRDQMKQDQQ